MNDNIYDLVVIGSGPAGEKGAAQAAYFGKRVCVIERAAEPGGAAVHTGTLPSKTLRESALYLSGFRSRDIYGVAVELEGDATVPALMARKAAIAAAESRRIRANLERHGVTYVSGHGCFVDEHCVAVRNGEGGAASEQLVRGEHFLIATGSVPRRPDDIDFDDDAIHDSDEILTIVDLPESLTILGGGVIGCEYACMFAALGVKVTLVDARDEVLGFLDGELVSRLTAAMEKLGIEIRRGAAWEEVARNGEGIDAKLADGTTVRSAELLFAAGRTGCSAGLGLEDIGVQVNSRGNIEVDENYCTNLRHIMAAGDVIGFPALASASMEQGRVAVCHAFHFDYKREVSNVIPYGIYTIPEVSAIGETEDGCLAKGIPHVVGRALYSENARGQITGDLEGITKLVVHAETRKLIGVHVIGERASELVHVGQAVLMLGGTVDVFIDMVFNFPTLAESYKYAAYECLARLNDKD